MPNKIGVIWLVAHVIKSVCSAGSPSKLSFETPTELPAILCMYEADLFHGDCKLRHTVHAYTVACLDDAHEVHSVDAILLYGTLDMPLGQLCPVCNSASCRQYQYAISCTARWSLVTPCYTPLPQ